MRQHFETRALRWLKDAIDAALVALARANKLTVILNGEPAAASALDGERPLVRRLSGRADISTYSCATRSRSPVSFSRWSGQSPTVTTLPSLRASSCAQAPWTGQSAGGEAPLPAVPRLPLEDEAQVLEPATRRQ